MSSVSGIAPVTSLKPIQISEPNTQKLEMGLPGTEKVLTFPENTKLFTIKSEKCGLIKIGTSSGNIANDDFYPLDPGESYSAQPINASVLSLYLTSSVNDDIIRVISWS